MAISSIHRHLHAGYKISGMTVRLSDINIAGKAVNNA